MTYIRSSFCFGSDLVREVLAFCFLCRAVGAEPLRVFVAHDGVGDLWGVAVLVPA